MLNIKERSISSAKKKLTIDRSSAYHRKRLTPLKGSPDEASKNNKNKRVKEGKENEKNRSQSEIKSKGEESKDNILTRTMSGFFPQLRSQKTVDLKGKDRRSQKLKTLYLNRKDIKSQIKQEDELYINTEELTQEFIKSLVGSNFVTRQAKTTLSIPENRLIELISYLIDALTRPAPEDIKKLHPNFYFSTHLLPKLRTIKSQFCRCDQLRHFQKGLESMSLKKSQKKAANMETQMQLQNLAELGEQVLQKELVLSQLNSEIDQAQKTISELRGDVSGLLETDGLLKKLRHKFNSFHLKEEHSINFQAKAKEYKTIESYMIDYAQYISTNNLLVSLDCSQELFEEEGNKINIRMKEVYGYLESKSHSLEMLKTKLLIEDLEAYHKSIQTELLRLCNLKTNAVKCYVRNVRSWLKNWEFRQEVLTDLKKLFVINSVKLKYKLYDAKIQAKTLNTSFMKILGEIQSIIEEMVDYFTIGNSFY